MLTPSLFRSVSVECLTSAFELLSGCYGDAVGYIEGERDAVLEIASQNPLVYLQPTATTILEAAAEELANGPNAPLSET